MRKLSLISLVLAVSGIIFLVGIIFFPFYESAILGLILSILRTLCLMSFALSIVTGLISLIWLKLKGGDAKERNNALGGIIISSFPIILYLFFLSGFWLRSFSGRFKECDPNELISIIKENYTFQLPDKMNELKAAKGAIHGIDHTYLFLFRFQTNQQGWEKFRKSICLTEPGNENSIDEDSCWDDWKDNSGDNKEFSDHHRAPKWYKAKVLTGKMFTNQLIGKEYYFIDEVYADILKSDEIIVYIVITKSM